MPHITQEAQSVAEALGLVREGFGVACVKGSELQWVKIGHLYEIPPDRQGLGGSPIVFVHAFGRTKPR